MNIGTLLSLSTEVESNPRPPLLVKLTGYRLLTIAIILSFGTAKAVKSLEGGTMTATWLDWVLGVFLGIMHVSHPSCSSFADVSEGYIG